MDRQAIMHHLRAWADGVDPATGAVLAADHPGQRADTLRVIFATIALLEEMETSDTATVRARPALNAAAASNAGRPWSPADDDALVQAFDAGSTVSALATGLGRTRGSITARLVKLGKMEAPPGLRMRGDTSVSTMSASVR